MDKISKELHSAQHTSKQQAFVPITRQNYFQKERWKIELRFKTRHNDGKPALRLALGFLFNFNTGIGIWSEERLGNGIENPPSRPSSRICNSDTSTTLWKTWLCFFLECRWPDSKKPKIAPGRWNTYMTVFRERDVPQLTTQDIFIHFWPRDPTTKWEFIKRCPRF